MYRILFTSGGNRTCKIYFKLIFSISIIIYYIEREVRIALTFVLLAKAIMKDAQPETPIQLEKCQYQIRNCYQNPLYNIQNQIFVSMMSPFVHSKTNEKYYEELFIEREEKREHCSQFSMHTNTNCTDFVHFSVYSVNKSRFSKCRLCKRHFYILFILR